MRARRLAERLLRPKVLLWVTGALAGVLFAGIALQLAPLRPGALALQFAFTARGFGEIVHWWPPDDLARYRAHFPADFALLACYGAFGWLLAGRTRLLAGRPPAVRAWFTAALPAAAVFDATENLLHLWLTAAPRFGVAWAYPLAAGAASLKWALLLAYALSLLHALLRSDR